VLKECKALTKWNQQKEKELEELRKRINTSATDGAQSACVQRSCREHVAVPEGVIIEEMSDERRTALMCKTDEINKRRELEAKCCNLEAYGANASRE
jgi:hypothetical protein